ncbi:hypothetical protein M1I87_004442 [Serratia marcescens]|nr:hypothetical protein [Serratia marcescens]
MTTIKRFTPDYKMHAVRFEAFAREAEHGELVRFDAHQQVVSAVEAERDAQQKRADALAVENAALKSRSIKLFNLGYLRGHESTVEGYFVDVHWCDIDTYHDDVVAEIIEDEEETPATDAALAAIQAQGLENARYSMSAGHADQRMAESRSVRAALGFNPDADDVSPSDLVDAINKINAELCVIRSAHPQPLGNAMDAAIDAFNAEEMPETGMLNAYFIMRDSIRVETPATDAALAAIQAQGLEKFADMCREKSKLATTADSCAGWKNCSVHASSFAIRLREAK